MLFSQNETNSSFSGITITDLFGGDTDTYTLSRSQRDFLYHVEFSPIRRNKIGFLKLFIDSYDWVMVPNAYAMSQHADGGLITTKPYFSGSAYIRKMSHYKPGRWSEIWDGLYWRWVWNHSEELAKNPRWAMMCSMARKMDQKKRSNHIDVAKTYMAGL